MLGTKGPSILGIASSATAAIKIDVAADDHDEESRRSSLSTTTVRRSGNIILRNFPTLVFFSVYTIFTYTTCLVNHADFEDFGGLWNRYRRSSISLRRPMVPLYQLKSLVGILPYCFGEYIDSGSGPGL